MIYEMNSSRDGGRVKRQRERERGKRRERGGRYER